MALKDVLSIKQVLVVELAGVSIVFKNKWIRLNQCTAHRKSQSCNRIINNHGVNEEDRNTVAKMLIVETCKN